MAETRLVKFEVLRFRPESDKEPVFETYEVPCMDDSVVLDALNAIKDDIDPTLSHRWSVAVSPALSLAASQLAGRRPAFEFLLPRVTPLQQVAARCTSGKLRTAVSAAAAVALVVGALFFYQQCQLLRLESQWARIKPTVRQLEALQEQIRQYRPWFDESVRGLTILRHLTEAFPEEGSVTAKTVEIRDLNAVTCTGIARDRQVLLKTIENVRKVPQFKEVALGPTGRGCPPG